MCWYRVVAVRTFASATPQSEPQGSLYYTRGYKLDWSANAPMIETIPNAALEAADVIDPSSNSAQVA